MTVIAGFVIDNALAGVSASIDNAAALSIHPFAPTHPKEAFVATSNRTPSIAALAVTNAHKAPPASKVSVSAQPTTAFAA
jgi:hypothetical protein